MPKSKASTSASSRKGSRTAGRQQYNIKDDHRLLKPNQAKQQQISSREMTTSIVSTSTGRSSAKTYEKFIEDIPGSSCEGISMVERISLYQAYLEDLDSTSKWKSSVTQVAKDRRSGSTRKSSTVSKTVNVQPGTVGELREPLPATVERGRGERQPVGELREPLHASVEGRHSGRQPVSNLCEPLRASVEGRHSERQPVCELREPLRASVEGRHSERQPVGNLCEPLRASVEGRHSEQQPVGNLCEPLRASVEGRHSERQPVGNLCEPLRASVEGRPGGRQPVGELCEPLRASVEGRHSGRQPVGELCESLHESVERGRGEQQTRVDEDNSDGNPGDKDGSEDDGIEVDLDLGLPEDDESDSTGSSYILTGTDRGYNERTVFKSDKDSSSKTFPKNVPIKSHEKQSCKEKAYSVKKLKISMDLARKGFTSHTEKPAEQSAPKLPSMHSVINLASDSESEAEDDDLSIVSCDLPKKRPKCCRCGKVKRLFKPFKGDLKHISSINKTGHQSCNSHDTPERHKHQNSLQHGKVIDLTID